MSATEAPARKSLRPVLGASAVFLLLLLLLGGLKGYRDLSVARQRVQELEEGIEEAEERIRLLEVQIERLRSDPFTLERRAREDLGLAMPGDLIYLLPEEGGSPNGAEGDGVGPEGDGSP